MARSPCLLANGSKSFPKERIEVFSEGRIGVAETFVGARCLVAKDAGDEAHGRVKDDGGCELATGEDVVADRELAVAEEFVDALIDSFVASANQDDAIEGREFRRDSLREPLSLRRKHNHALFRCAQ